MIMKPIIYTFFIFTSLHLPIHGSDGGEAPLEGAASAAVSGARGAADTTLLTDEALATALAASEAGSAFAISAEDRASLEAIHEAAKVRNAAGEVIRNLLGDGQNVHTTNSVFLKTHVPTMLGILAKYLPETPASSLDEMKDRVVESPAGSRFSAEVGAAFARLGAYVATTPLEPETGLDTLSVTRRVFQLTGALEGSEFMYLRTRHVIVRGGIYGEGTLVDMPEILSVSPLELLALSITENQREGGGCYAGYAGRMGYLILRMGFQFLGA